MSRNKIIDLIQDSKEYNIELIALDVKEYLEVETLIKIGVNYMSGVYFAPWSSNPNEIEYSKTKKLVHLLGDSYFRKGDLDENN